MHVHIKPDASHRFVTMLATVAVMINGTTIINLSRGKTHPISHATSLCKTSSSSTSQLSSILSTFIHVLHKVERRLEREKDRD
jgi:hypothetical protein